MSTKSQISPPHLAKVTKINFPLYFSNNICYNDEQYINKSIWRINICLHTAVTSGNLLWNVLLKISKQCYIADTKDDVVPLIKRIMNDGDTVACGGSMTLTECGVHELLKSGAYNYLDRDGKTGDELQAVFRGAFPQTAIFQVLMQLPKTVSFTMLTETAIALQQFVVVQNP